MVIFPIAAALIAYLAFRGGAYDAIVRQEYGLVLCAALGLGLIFGIMPRGAFRGLDLVPLGALVALGVLIFIHLATSPTDERTFAELSRVTTFAATMALPILVLNRYTWRAAAGGIVVGTILVAAYTFGTRVAPGIFDHDSVVTGNRLSYPFDYWNAVGTWGAAAAVVGIAWSAHSRNRIIRPLALATVPVALLCIYLSYSRGGWVALAAGVVAAVAVSRNRWTAAAHTGAALAGGALAVLVTRSQPEIAQGTGGSGGEIVALALLGAAIGCAAVALVTQAAGTDRLKVSPETTRVLVPAAAIAILVAAVAAGGSGLIGDAWDEFNGDTAPIVAADPAERIPTAASTRSEVWEVALEAFADDPVTGIGPGTFETYWAQHSPTQEYLRDAHSLYIEQLAELGLLGLALVLVAIVGGLVVAVRARVGMKRTIDTGAAAAMIAVGVVVAVSLAMDWMWELTAVTALGLCAIGTVIAAGAERMRSRRFSPYLRAGAIVLALVFAALQVPGLISTSRERESTDALVAGDIGRALELADDGIAAEPWSATAHLQRAAVNAAGERLKEARADVRKAIDRDPEGWRPWLALVQIELARGDDAAAERAFERLEQFSLLSAVPYASLTHLKADARVSESAGRGCLAYTIGSCG